MQMHLGRVLSGDCLLFFVPLLCDACVGYVLWFGVRSVCMCVRGAAGEGLYLAAPYVCLCVHNHTCVRYCFLSSLKIFAFL